MTLFKNIKRKKIFFGVGIFFVVVFVFLLIIEGWNYYNQWKGEKRIDELAQELRHLDREDYERKAADKIGGKTPKETLELFIQAVENGDYELASKYFVVEKQEEELKSLQNSPKENIKNVMELLKQAKISKGSYSLTKNQFIVRKPILVNFILYPSDNWKIEEI